MESDEEPSYQLVPSGPMKLFCLSDSSDVDSQGTDESDGQVELDTTQWKDPEGSEESDTLDLTLPGVCDGNDIVNNENSQSDSSYSDAQSDDSAGSPRDTDVSSTVIAPLVSRPKPAQPNGHMRKKSKTMSERINRLTDRDTMSYGSEKVGPCCRKECYTKYDPSQVQVLRNALDPRRRPVQSQAKRIFIDSRWIADSASGQDPLMSPGRRSKHFHCDSPGVCSDLTGSEELLQECPSRAPDALTRVCHNFFSWAYGVSSSSVYGTSCSPKGFLSVTDRKHMPVSRSRSKRLENAVVNWLTDLSSFYCHSPITNSIHLPFATKHVVYQQYIADAGPTATECARKAWNAQHDSRRRRRYKHDNDAARVMAPGIFSQGSGTAPMNVWSDRAPATLQREGKSTDEFFNNPSESADDLASTEQAMLSGTDVYLDPLTPTDDMPFVSFTYFLQVWRENDKTKSIILRKYLCFNKCTTCESLRKQHNETSDTATRGRVEVELREHRLFVQKERQEYSARREEAIRRPNEALSVVIDGADSLRYQVPNLKQKVSALQKVAPLRYNLMGAIVHGRGCKVYTVPHFYKQGTNVTLYVLQDIVQSLIRTSQGNLPKTLYLQLDNTCKQNKNRFLASYLALLVHWGIFKRVKVSYLPVGHTHEDIDQMFSRLSVAMRRRQARSWLELKTVLEQAYSDRDGRRLIVEHMGNLPDCSGWIDKQLQGVVNYVIDTPSRRSLELYGYRQWLITKENIITNPGEANENYELTVIFKVRMESGPEKANPPDAEKWRGLKCTSDRAGSVVIDAWHRMFKVGSAIPR